MSAKLSLLLLLILSLTGCLPSSQRQHSRALFPSDSLSRQVAETIQVEEIDLTWMAEGPAQQRFEIPYTVAFGPDGYIYASDVQRGSIFVFAGDGTFTAEIRPGTFVHPHIAGFRGDTLAVFNTGAARVDFVHEGRVVRSFNVPDAPISTVHVNQDRIFFKAVGQEIQGYIQELDAGGKPAAHRVELPGAYWRHTGFMRSWGDTLLSLSGYRPVIDRVSEEGRLDTLALTGFDSPMLNRSRLFMLGKIRQPPLLSTGAEPVNDLLFVLNLRPGWTHVDVYDREGRLQHVLEEAERTYNRQFYPLDIAARTLGDYGYEIAVVAVKPVPRLYLYRWQRSNLLSHAPLTE